MLHIGDFKEVVASFVGREPDYFTYNEDGKPGPDKLLIAVNNAKMFLQRQIDFEWSRCAVDFLVDPVLGGSLDQCVDRVTGDVIPIKKVDDFFLKVNYDRMKPLRRMTRRTMVEQVRRGEDTNFHTNFEHHGEGYESHDRRDHRGGLAGARRNDPIVYTHGRNVFVWPSINNESWESYKHWYPSDYIANLPESRLKPLPLTMDVIKFLPSYRNEQGAAGMDDPRGTPHTTDFILDHCMDYMLFRTLSELNCFLKDTEQVTISQSKMNECLENIRQWNADLDPVDSTF